MKEVVVHHFQTTFSGSCFERRLLASIPFKQVFASDSSSLVVPFSEIEIKDVVWSCNGDKCNIPNRS